MLFMNPKILCFFSVIHKLLSAKEVASICLSELTYASFFDLERTIHCLIFSASTGLNFHLDGARTRGFQNIFQAKIIMCGFMDSYLIDWHHAELEMLASVPPLSLFKSPLSRLLCFRGFLCHHRSVCHNMQANQMKECGQSYISNKSDEGVWTKLYIQ